jgi:hypothetical protein
MDGSSSTTKTEFSAVFIQTIGILRGTYWRQLRSGAAYGRVARFGTCFGGEPSPYGIGWREAPGEGSPLRPIVLRSLCIVGRAPLIRRFAPLSPGGRRTRPTFPLTWTAVVTHRAHRKRWATLRPTSSPHQPSERRPAPVLRPR